jgi:predicted ATPase/DNA-binding SARP family transcriptional activator
MRVDIELLGGFVVAVDGRRVPDTSWRRRHAAALVKLLALRPGRRLPREQVMDALWPDLLVDEAAPRLHKAAHFARTALGSQDSVVLAADVVSLFPTAEVTIDVDQFDEAVEAYRSGGNLARADDAIDVYRGALLPDDLYEPWTESERERRRLAYLGLLRERERWEELVAAEPLDEEAHLRLASEHLQRGDGSSALRQLELMGQVWRRELDAEPGEAAQALRTEAAALSSEAGQAAVAAVAPRRTPPIPRPATPTIGRERDVALVLDLLERSRIVTLLGVGGVGKTRLAGEVAHRHIEATGRQGFYVDLTKIRGADLVPELMLRELGVHHGAASNTAQLLEEALRGQSMLIVLDNFEHVVDAAELVAAIVSWSPALRVLVTSRARLRISGEHVFDVTPLPVVAEAGDGGAGDAVMLFGQVASAVDPRFRLEHHLDDVVAICRSVDGLPLAIELAAGHVRTLPPKLLRVRLSARLGSPTAAARDAHPRQQTIPATIDWSLQLLGADEQRLFARLGIFAGAIGLEAVERVCAEPGRETIDALIHLVDQSLVRRVMVGRTEARFVLLELLRERARELLAGEYDVIAARHADYVASFLEEMDDRRWTDAADHWIDDITQLLGEVRTAHAWALNRGDLRINARIAAALGTYWHLEGHHVEGRRWVKDVLAREAELDDLLVGRIHIGAGFLEWPNGQLAARQHWERAIELLRPLGHDRYLAYALFLTSATFLGEDDSFEYAMRLNDEGVSLARQVGERPLIAQALNVRGEMARVAGHDELARAAYEEGLELSIAMGDQAYVALLQANLSYLASHRGEHEEAHRLVREALRVSWSQGRRMMAAWTVSETAGPELALGRPERAARLVGAADEALRALGAGRHPGDWPEHERVVAGLRAALGDETFLRLKAEGARLSLDEAVALALSSPDDREDLIPQPRGMPSVESGTEERLTVEP